MSEWRKVRLGEVCEIIGGGTPKTTNAEFWNGDIPWLSVVDFNNDFRYVSKTEKRITNIGLNSSSTKLLNKSDLIISARGTVGALAQLTCPMAFNQSCYGIRGKRSTINDFLYYAIKNIVGMIKNNTHGSVFDTITRDTFDVLEILLPPLPEQKRIADILSCLDDKIELNNRMNKTLEEMAQAIFKSWFIDFEPWGGVMPKDWREGTLGEIISFTKGKKPKELTLIKTENSIDYVTIEYFAGTNQYTTEVEKLVFCDVLDCLMVMDGASSGTVYYGAKGAVGSTFAKINVEENFLEIVYWYFKLNESEIKKHNTGSAIPHTDKNFINLMSFYFPVINDIKNLVCILKNIRIKIIANNHQSQTLAAIRDTLLPKLMSGEIKTKP